MSDRFQLGFGLVWICSDSITVILFIQNKCLTERTDLSLPQIKRKEDIENEKLKLMAIKTTFENTVKPELTATSE